MKTLKRLLWISLCGVIFFSVFSISAITKIAKVAGVSTDRFTLQNKTADDAKYEGAIQKKIIDIPYITNEGAVETRQVLYYRPEDAEGDIPLIFIPHYAAEESSTDFQLYILHGWAVASPVFKEKYNGQLTDDNLVFNNAALYTLRNMDGIDDQRIAIAGGSAGGYMALMLSELQMGICATIANSPISNIYYNLYIHFQNCDEVNQNSGFFDIPIPIQLFVSKSFRSNLNNFPDVSDTDRWAALSPLGNVRSISSPVVINHYTGDILVPVDQISKQYTYTESDGTLPVDFPVRMGKDYPGILGHSLEEEADPDEVYTRRYLLNTKHIDMDMPYSDCLLTINIFDDGPMSAKNSHTAPGTTGNINVIPYLEEMFSRTLANTEELSSEKLILLLTRYLGNSAQLLAHENINDTVYGSLFIYRKEIIDELSQYIANHSIEELERFVEVAIASSENKAELITSWEEIKQLLHPQKFSRGKADAKP